VFRHLDWVEAASLMRQAILVDGRNALSIRELLDAGFTYSSFGRGVWDAGDEGGRRAVATREVRTDGHGPETPDAAQTAVVQDDARVIRRPSATSDRDLARAD
jgi:hypothetical protein